MKATEQSLNKFLSQADTQFIIPVYQRNYDWGQPQCKQFFEDICEAGTKNEIKAHFIGSIVYVHDDIYTTSSKTELTIIDGQQRLTTVTLLYLSILKLAKRLGQTDLHNKINETYLINKFSSDEEKLKLRPTENNDKILKDLIRMDGQNNASQEFSRLIENYNYFSNRISEENYEIILKGLNKLMFVEISLDRVNDEPQRIFESLNSTGLDLSQADLIRNYILMGLKRNHQNLIYEKYWEKIEIFSYDKSSNTSFVSDFIRDFLILEFKIIPIKNKVYHEFKERYPKTDETDLEKILLKIKQYANLYHKLINHRVEPDEKVREQFHYIKRLDFNVAFPFLLKIYNDYDQKVISKDIFIQVLELIQSFVWRRFILSLPTNALSKIFLRLYDDIDHKNYLHSLEKALLKKKGVQRFPRNEEVALALKDKDVYNIKPKNRFYLFEKIENFNNVEKVKIEGNKNITIEHIFPKNPDSSWEKSLPLAEYNEIKEKRVNTIANLTLSGYNGPLSNKSFIEKRDMNVDGKEQGYKYSKLWLNRSLGKIQKWGLGEIDNRFNTLLYRFFQTWPFPKGEMDHIVESDEINIFDAEDPKHKKMEYAVFFDQKINTTEVNKLYIHVIKTLFELKPQTFFTTDLQERVNITKEPEKCRNAAKISETYYIETNFDSNSKFERIKQALTILDLEDELFIKYADS